MKNLISCPVILLACAALLTACGGGGGGTSDSGNAANVVNAGGTPGQVGSSLPMGTGQTLPIFSGNLPAAGNTASSVVVPAAAQAVNTASPARRIGTGTPESCTSAAVVSAVAQGGIITFNCGAAPMTITMTGTAKVFNDRPDVTLDGGGLVTLDGAGNTRILYQNTCDSAQVFTSPRCDIQDTPRLTVQNLTFRNGNSTGQIADGGGGGAIFVRGGQFKIVNSRFFNNQCDAAGPDVGGGAVRVVGILSSNPVYVVGSTFGGAAGLGNKCSNGGALSSLGVSYSVINSVLSHNEAIGNGANPAQAGTPGGGSGGAIYNDGNFFSLLISGSRVTDNTANEGGGAVFYVSNDRSGTLSLNASAFARNLSRGFETSGLPGFFVIAAPGQPVIAGSTFSVN